MFLVCPLRLGLFSSKLENECFFLLCFGKRELRSNWKNEGFIRALLSKFGFLTVLVFSFFLCRFGKLVWCLARKSVLAFRKAKQKPYFVTRRCSTVRFANSTGCKSPFCGFAAQKFSTKSPLTNCGWAWRYVLLKVLFCAILKVRKTKTG